MPEVRELILQSPSMRDSYFHVTIEGKDHQKWEHSIGYGDEIECFLEDQRWQKGVVRNWYIPDGSGNTPGADAHFFLTWEDKDGTWRYDLHAGLRVRLEVPTHAELVAASKWCEGGDFEGGYNAPAQWVRCTRYGKQYSAGGGQAVWYCDAHKPAWVK